MKQALLVLRKEIKDALRDRRTLMVVLLSSVLMGPLLLVALSHLLASFEVQAQERVVMAQGLGHAPSLRNFFERQAYVIESAPADFETQLRLGQLPKAVLVVPPDFDALLRQDAQPSLEIMHDSGNRPSQTAAAKLMRLLQGYQREHVTLRLLLRGVAPQVSEPVQLQERDLASPQSRAAQLTAMLPFFVIMAVLYGALNAALDTTAGERERRSLAPLLTNPVSMWALVCGKWGAVVAVAMLIAALSTLSFLPAQWLLQSDTLQAMFQFGGYEAAMFILILAPLALLLSAALMAVAMRCKTFKEAQASSSVLVLLTSMLPLVSVFNQAGPLPWHLWVPALAQHTLMTRVLKGEVVSPAAFGVPLVLALLTTGCLVWGMTRQLRRAV